MSDDGDEESGEHPELPPLEMPEFTPEEEAEYAVKRPRGDAVTELAAERDIDPELVREKAAPSVRSHDLIAETEGRDGDPRLYRNPLTSLFDRVWAYYAATDGPKELEDRIEEYTSEIEEYREETGYDHPNDLVDDFEDADLSHIDTPDTGEVYWDVVSPWSTAIRGRQIARFVLDNYEFLDGWTSEHTEMDITGVFGDFSDYNEVEERLGLDD